MKKGWVMLVAVENGLGNLKLEWLMTIGSPQLGLGRVWVI